MIFEKKNKWKPILKITSWLTLPVLLIIFYFTNGEKMKSGVFTVKSGHHYSSYVFPLQIFTESPKINFMYRIDDGVYAANNKDGISKIYGFSEGDHHHNSSARLGFIVKDNVITVKAYCYADGVSPQQNETQKPTIGTIEPNRWYSCKISRIDGYYVFNHEGMKEVKVNAGKSHIWGYLLMPYIGGRFTLDKDIKIEIKLLNY